MGRRMITSEMGYRDKQITRAKPAGVYKGGEL
jgi:hypothetical protein